MPAPTTPTHTPGPWAVSDHALDAKHTILDAKRGNRVGRFAIAQLISGYTEDEAEANAHLIAAAPELLAALVEMERLATSELWNTGVMKPEFGRALTQARAAITKATNA